jgi:hypothetical protein
MPELSRSQLVVYAAIAVAVVVIGARWIRSSGAGSTGGAELSFVADSAHEGEGTRDLVVPVSTASQRARGSPTQSAGPAVSPAAQTAM